MHVQNGYIDDKCFYVDWCWLLKDKGGVEDGWIEGGGLVGGLVLPLLFTIIFSCIFIPSHVIAL